MSKIICEICGTAYPETSTQCPICGYVRSADAAAVATPDSTDESSKSYTYVKGGRFSKSNVKKRNRANQKSDNANSVGAAAVASRRQEQQPKKKNKKNIGFIVVSIILLLLLLAFVLFLVCKVFWPALPEVPAEEPSSSEQTESTVLTIACESIELDATEVTLTEVGAARMIYATPSPANTTDTLEYTSSDESVVTVTDSGKIVAVGPGEATITVTCGDAQVSCQVICKIESETEDPTEETDETTEATEEPTEETTEEPSVSLEDFEFNRSDFTLLRAGEKWTLYNGDIDPSLITWTSDDESVATIVDGVVTAVGRGKTEVHAEINGVKITCIVRCNF